MNPMLNRPHPQPKTYVITYDHFQDLKARGEVITGLTTFQNAEGMAVSSGLRKI